MQEIASNTNDLEYDRFLKYYLRSAVNTLIELAMQRDLFAQL